MTKIPYFDSLKEAQAWLDYYYSLPLWRLATKEEIAKSRKSNQEQTSK